MRERERERERRGEESGGESGGIITEVQSMTTKDTELFREAGRDENFLGFVLDQSK